MGLFDTVAREAAEQMDSARSSQPDADGEQPPAAATATVQQRGSTVTVAGEDVPVEEPDTQQTGEEGNWITGSSRYGIPRGREALEARQIVQTSAMQAITNGIIDQLVGGELAFENDDGDGDLGDVEADLRDVIRDVLQGPHLKDEDLDDLITAAVEDMLGPGDAYWQLLAPAEDSGVDLPVVSLASLDALTIRRNMNRHGYPLDPPYYQAQGAFSSSGVSGLNQVDPVPLQPDDLAVMQYPRGNRSYRYYPQSPSHQVREWLEILANSTTHHNRFYSDNEIPPGLIQVIGASSVDDVKEKIQAASGDPRDVPVIGGDGGAQWIELGGTAVNLNIIEEQKWFFQMCLASLGLGKQELGFIEDVNRANGEVEATRVYKRVAGPFGKQFDSAFRHVAEQFEAYNALDQPFDIRLRFTDPREEHARQERMKQQYQAGIRTYNDVQEALGNDPSELETEVEVDGQVVDYGEHPKHVVDRLLGGGVNDPGEEPVGAPDDGGDGDGGDDDAE